MRFLESGSELGPIYELDGFLEKALGLIGRKTSRGTWVFPHCNSIHTFFMKEEIDVAFISEEGKVLKVLSSVRPGRILKEGGATTTAERFSSKNNWFKEGETYEILSSL